MSFLSPLGLLALLGVPAVLALHLFRRRLRQRRVAGLFLFAPDALAAQSGRKRTRLLRSASLWLELAAATLLGLWLGGLSFGAAAGDAHLVVVLDDSASMGARSRDGSTVERALAAIRSTAAEAGRSARVSLVLSGARPQIALGPRAPIGQLDAALDRWQPGRPDHDLAPALDLGRELGGTIRLAVTDRPDVAVPAGYRLLAVGTPLPNAAIVSARRVPGDDEAKERVYVDLLATGAGSLPTELRVDEAGGAPSAPIAVRPVTLEPGRATHLSFSCEKTRAALTVSLADDALAVDNTVTLLPAPVAVVRVAILLDAESAARLRLSKMLSSLTGVVAASDPARADVVFTAAAGALRPGTIEILVGPTSEERDDWIGPFLLERRHPLLVGMTLEGVVWGAGRGTPAGVPLVLAGNQALLSEETRGGGTRLHLNLDPSRTNLPSSPDWPIWLSNVIEHARELLPGPGEVNLRVGEPIEYRVRTTAGSSEALELVDPDERRRKARGLQLRTWDTRRPGVHRLVREDDTEVARFAVHFVDAAESDLTRCGAADVAARPLPVGDREAETAGIGRTGLTVLALLALAAAVADWFVLGARRQTA